MHTIKSEYPFICLQFKEVLGKIPTFADVEVEAM